MRQALDIMKIALRVLTAVSEKRSPDPEDCKTLRQYAGPRSEDLAIDELSCTVIQQALKRRAEARAGNPNYIRTVAP